MSAEQELSDCYEHPDFVFVHVELFEQTGVFPVPNFDEIVFASRGNLIIVDLADSENGLGVSLERLFAFLFPVVPNANGGVK